MNSTHHEEIIQRKRFNFGSNWANFLNALSDKKIEYATTSLREMLGTDHLRGMRFLDVGSGSGLFSLAARRLGADVFSFDYDPSSVECTRELRQRYFPQDCAWIIEEASVLDQEYLRKLGTFDVVYSWGVLHHTGDMWQALNNVIPLVSEKLFIAIYNDQGWISKYWTAVKRFYNSSKLGQVLMIALHFPYLYLFRLLIRNISGRQLERGMNLWNDMLDWLGGYPFEVAQPIDILNFYKTHGFICIKMKICGNRSGCNEFVFHRI